MTANQRRSSLKVKILVPMVALLTAISLLIGVSAYVQQRSVLTQMMDATATAALPHERTDVDAPPALNGQPVITPDISSLIAGETVGQGGYLIAFNTDGRIAYHPETDLIGQKLPAADNTWVSQVLTKGSGNITYVWNDKTYYAVFGQVGEQIVMATVPTAEYYDQLGSVLTMIGLTILLAIVLGSFLVNTIAERVILRQVRAVESALESAGAGDLRSHMEVTSQDELGRLSGGVNQMIANLRDTLTQVAAVVQTLTQNAQEMAAGAGEAGRATEEIASTVAELALGAEKQSTTTMESAGKVEGILAALTESNNFTQATADDAEAAAKLIQEGNSAVELQQSKMEDNVAATKAVGTAINDLQQRVAQIGQFSSAIMQIASQTNLLALNAAIEAARAGESGRGFAVVAEEVRNLADQSAKAANQISALITEVEQSTNHAVEQMGVAGKVVEVQSQAVARTSVVFEQIDQMVRGMTEQIQQIAMASGEVTKETNAVATAIDELAAISEQSAASSQEVAASTQEQNAAIQQLGASVEQIASVADSLRQLINRFKM